MNKPGYTLMMCDRCKKVAVKRNGTCMNCGKDHGKEQKEGK